MVSCIWPRSSIAFCTGSPIDHYVAVGRFREPGNRFVSGVVKRGRLGFVSSSGLAFVGLVGRRATWLAYGAYAVVMARLRGRLRRLAWREAIYLYIGRVERRSAGGRSDGWAAETVYR